MPRDNSPELIPTLRSNCMIFEFPTLCPCCAYPQKSAGNSKVIQFDRNVGRSFDELSLILDIFLNKWDFFSWSLNNCIYLTYFLCIKCTIIYGSKCFRNTDCARFRCGLNQSHEAWPQMVDYTNVVTFGNWQRETWNLNFKTLPYFPPQGPNFSSSMMMKT